MRRKSIVILSGSGISAESGLPTYRDSNGLWRNHNWMELASPEGWARQPELVLEFYNERRAKAWEVEPNAAHRAIAELEKHHDVVVITQNVDALHERAGSSHVVHLHGELAWVRGSSPRARRYRVDGAPIHIGDRCEDGTQLRPDIVWFGEAVPKMEEAIALVRKASHLLVVGTSLVVYPAASLVGYAPDDAVKVLVGLEPETVPPGYEFRQGKATERVPEVVAEWLSAAG
ncbi:MAG TPA: Sir2 family NAD-dependent protein deacetylase [Candidatus Eisenbacteria bacterium]